MRTYRAVRFLQEQYRVLKQGGVCLVLSSRKGITVAPDCYATSDYEKAFWQKAAQYDNTLTKYAVGKYAMNEAEMPAVMGQYGLKNIHTGYVLVDLTPDNPNVTPEFAHAIINADRYSDIESIQHVKQSMPTHFSSEEIEKMAKIVNDKYDTRIKLYNCGEKQWDTAVSVVMIIRGIK